VRFDGRLDPCNVAVRAAFDVRRAERVDIHVRHGDGAQHDSAVYAPRQLHTGRLLRPAARPDHMWRLQLHMEPPVTEAGCRLNHLLQQPPRGLPEQMLPGRHPAVLVQRL
jgi:hypothetical protein